MDTLKVALGVAIALVIVFAGAFGYSYYQNSKTSSAYSTAQANAQDYKPNAVLGDAFEHWNNIAIENTTLVSSQYLSNATLQWIGGPLSGTYTGLSAIDSTWNKFFGLWSAVWLYTSNPPVVTTSGDTAQVTAPVQFIVTPFNVNNTVEYINVSYTLDFMKSGGQFYITHEVWHITGAGILASVPSAVLTQEVEAQAMEHWDYIAIENTSLLQPEYASNATLDWIGGPLTGTYSGVSSIIGTWGKFFGLWSAVWFYTVTPPSVSVIGKTATVTSMNQFIVTPTSANNTVEYLNISYTLNYYKEMGQYKIVGETWHIVGTGYISTNENQDMYNQVLALAFSHWNNIAIENLTSVMEQYNDSATLYWVNSTLNGTYQGYSNISAVWNKFFKAWIAVWFYAEEPPTVAMKGDMAYVNATVQFVVQKNATTFDYINVSYQIVYQNMGFNVKTGQFQFEIVSEVFNVLGGAPGPLNKV
ncbi:TVG1353500 [Thermoplasma volcanium GSS1]|uniref:TVG1353500 protein n=1 Tax=Thermoplasma volcanium (strain ATCC 51530 / DSM 4299 / JCM 9571 / NBRC 15438 / GSS1) TaxID=273116 RepID=Q978V2_THEVO|nr:membrane protein [Thermoplasma volcanium]BAB60455.1 TVG1353500 [Thermoplasma volcanium GSS1]